jgi:Na+-translocating ferredoxin:NAD+ oxidoreductase RnfG subunit
MSGKIRVTIITLFCAISLLQAQVFKSQEAALKETFTEADTVMRETLFLDEAQQQEIEAEAKMPLTSAIVSYYVGYKAGKPYRYAFFEDQIVRTKKAVVLIAISAGGQIEKMEVLAFYEPLDYLPISRWFNLFVGKTSEDAIMPGQDIDGVSGATLSVRAFSGIARRALAIFNHILETQK